MNKFIYKCCAFKVMKLLNKNKEEVKVEVENLDDLWYLSSLIDIGDLVKGNTVIKIKIFF